MPGRPRIKGLWWRVWDLMCVCVWEREWTYASVCVTTGVCEGKAERQSEKGLVYALICVILSTVCSFMSLLHVRVDDISIFKWLHVTRTERAREQVGKGSFLKNIYLQNLRKAHRMFKNTTNTTSPSNTVLPLSLCHCPPPPPPQWIRLGWWTA